MTLRDKIAKIIHVELLKQAQGLGLIVEDYEHSGETGQLLMVDGMVNLTELARKVEGLIDG